MRILPATAFTLFVGAVSSVAAQAKNESSNTLTPAVRLDRPGWVALNDRQITALFSDRRLEFDEKYEPVPNVKVGVRFYGGCPTIETFHADGTWEMFFCSQGPTTYHGRWAVEAHGKVGWLCVQSADWPTGCRIVWQTSAANHVIMKLEGPDAERLWGRDGAYNPYRLVPA
jgi:hypothetical protein